MKHAVIIGGTRGIGAGIAQTLHAKGWRLTVTGVTQAEVDAFAPHNPDITCAVLDVRDTAAGERLFRPNPPAGRIGQLRRHLNARRGIRYRNL